MEDKCFCKKVTGKIKYISAAGGFFATPQQVCSAKGISLNYE